MITGYFGESSRFVDGAIDASIERTIFRSTGFVGYGDFYRNFLVLGIGCFIWFRTAGLIVVGCDGGVVPCGWVYFAAYVVFTGGPRTMRWGQWWSKSSRVLREQ